MREEEYLRIPLGGRYKSKPVKHWALIDPIDAVMQVWNWTLNDSGYAVHTMEINRGGGRRGSRVYRLHRMILGLPHGDPREGDHINGNRLDCRRANLRIVTRKENSQNMASHRDALSPYRGVSWFAPKGKWMARAHIDGKSHHLGYFDDDAKAGEVAQAFREAHMTHNVESRH